MENSVNKRNQFISSGEGVMHSKSDKMEFMIYVNADEVIEKLFESFFSRYQIGLGTSVRVNE